MDTNVRKLLFTPLSDGALSAIIPDFYIEHTSGRINVPALLTSDGNSFKFTLHFMQGTPPSELGNLKKQVVTEKDQLTVGGQINGEIAFRCSDVFPPAGLTTRSRGTSTIKLRSSRMELVAEGSDTLDNRQMHDMLKMPVKRTTARSSPFHAHVIFHGPKLLIIDSGTETKRKNNYLGEVTGSSFDTHVFSDTDYEGALIQDKEEIHLHLRSKEGDSVMVPEPSNLVDRVAWSVGLAFGFHPWPVYREVRIDHRVTERWLSPRLGLSQTFFGPLSESLGQHYRTERSNQLYAIIPTLAAGLSRLQNNERKRIEILLWTVRSNDLSKMPYSTKVLILCSALDGLMQVIGQLADQPKRPATNKMWRRASDELGFSWDRWTKGIFELRKKYRDDLSHGRLWVGEEQDFGETTQDYALLCCGFMTMIAARCGYEGPVIADPYKPRQVVIGSLKESATPSSKRPDES